MPRLRRDAVTWLIYAQLGLWGYVLYGFGPVVPLMRDEQGTSATVASLHGAAIAAGTILGGGILLPPLVRRFGRGGTLWFATLGVAGAVGVLWMSRPLAATLAATVLMAVFGSLVVGTVVASLSTLHGPAAPTAIAEANAVACGLGVIAPIVVGLAVRAGLGWRPGLAVAIGLVALTALVAVVFKVRVPRGAATSTVDSPAASTVERQPLSSAYWLAWTLMAITGSVEVCLSLWAADVLRVRAGMDPGGAATAVSAIVAGMFVGRLIGGRLALRIPVVPLFLGVLAVSAAGFGLFWAATAPAVSIAGLVVLGIGNAMHYPLGIATALRTAPGQEDRAAAKASYGMAIGFGAAPFALGAAADGFGAHAAFLLVPVFLVAAAALVIRLGRRLPVAAPALATASRAAGPGRQRPTPA